MYIYFHFQEDWNKPNAMAFNKSDQAVEYVIERIVEYLGCGGVKKPKKKKSIQDVMEPYIELPLQQGIRARAQLQNPFQHYGSPDLVQKLEKSNTSQIELSTIQEQIAITTTNKIIENAKKLIDQYDEYMKNYYNISSFLHTIQEIGVIDESF